jgi:sugar lactone lactonase YvrE
VLEANGAIVEIDIRQAKRGSVVYQPNPVYRVLNLSARAHGRSPFACATVHLDERASFHAWLVQPVDARRHAWAWLPGRSYYTGCAFDDSRSIVYVASTTGEVYRVPVGGTSVDRFASISGVNELGPLAFNGMRRLLVVADAKSRTLYTLNVDTKAVSRLTRLRSGDIRALAFTPQGDRLYIADSDDETIWTIDLKSTLAVRAFADLPEFREPTGVAVDPAGRVWVAERRLRKVLQLSADGRKVERSVDWAPSSISAAK